MSNRIHAIGTSNGGGGCFGRNAVIRAVVKAAVNDYGWREAGIAFGDRP